MPMKHTQVVNFTNFTLQASIFNYVEGNDVVIEHVPHNQTVDFLKEKIATKDVEQIKLVGPKSYTENIKNQLYSSLEFSENPIKIELTEEF